jgi:hypothetical protein
MLAMVSLRRSYEASSLQLLMVILEDENQSQNEIQLVSCLSLPSKMRYKHVWTAARSRHHQNRRLQHNIEENLHLR